MTSKITEKLLRERNACDDAVEWFEKEFPRGAFMSRVVAACPRGDWLIWGLWKSGITTIEHIILAGLTAGRRSLRFADNRKMCRAAFDAAEKTAMNNTEKNRAAGADDYSYARPSRRGSVLGIILPGLYADKCPRVVICVDTSGSMSASDLGSAVAEIRGLLRTRLSSDLVIIEADAAVHRVTEIGPHDDWTPGRLSGGGGTDFRPALTKAAEYDPALVIYISDLEGTFPDDIHTDMLWLTRSDQTAPVGRTLRMAEGA